MILENELLQLALGMAQAVLLLLCAPLVTGIVKKVKAWMQNRIGSSIWQEYYDIRKWWGKPTMLTPYTSITFRLAPCVYFLTTFAAACMLPGFLGGQASATFLYLYICWLWDASLWQFPQWMQPPPSVAWAAAARFTWQPSLSLW